MSKFEYFLKIFIHLFLLRSKLCFFLISLFFYFYLKFFKKNEFNKYRNFFLNFSKSKNIKNFNKKNCIHINFFSWLDLENTLFSFFVINLIGSKNNNIIYFKTGFLKFFTTQKKFVFEYPLNLYSKLSFFHLQSEASKIMQSSYQDIFNFKYKGIKCGKYSISSAIRVLRTPDINLKNKKHYYTLKFFLIKSLMFSDASIIYLNSNRNIEYAIFNDKSYVGAGELFDQCIIKKLKCIQFVASYKNNILLLKKFSEKNQYDHPGSISDEVWEKFQNEQLNDKQKNFLTNEIRTQYENNTWYPSAGTMVGKQFLNLDFFFKDTKLDKRKKTAIIFPHIFWDGTFFFGKDLFKNYVEWYKETLKAANANKNLNWIIKSHPSNFIKNNRDKISNKTEQELKIINELFGEMPKHFTYIDSNSKIKTSQLIDFLDYCFTIRGTVGIEAALKNKIVITAGTGRYDSRGFTYNFDDKKNYFDFINNLHNFDHTNKDVVKNAEKFAYISFICKTFELNSVNFFYEKNYLANLNFEINFEELNNNLNFDNSMIELHQWINGNKNDYFKDPCKEWYVN